jgi:hypothetical protein
MGYYRSRGNIQIQLLWQTRRSRGEIPKELAITSTTSCCHPFFLEEGWNRSNLPLHRPFPSVGWKGAAIAYSSVQSSSRPMISGGFHKAECRNV